MSFAVDIEDSRVEKISLVKVAPRVRITGWTLDSGTVYKKVVAKPKRIWIYEAVGGPYIDPPETERGFSPTLGDIALYGAYYDTGTGTLYINWTRGGSPDSPPFGVQAGVTAAYEIFISSSNQSGLSDPLEPSSDVVDWEGKLLEVPFPTSGSRDNLFGFLPVSNGAIRFINDGWFSPYFDRVWKNADVSVYILTGRTMEEAIAYGGVRQVFLGFVTGLSESNGTVSINCSDYLSILDNKIRTPGFTYNIFDFPNGEQGLSTLPIREVYGMVDSFRPINMAVGGAATFNNRYWGGTFNGPEYLQYTVDHTQANTSTRTYTTTRPKYNPGDSVDFLDNAGCYAFVTACYPDLNYFEHTSISRTVSAGNRVTRGHIANVSIIDRDGNHYFLKLTEHYTLFTGGNSHGFRLIDNVEAALGMAHSPFDPSQDRIVCRAYGTMNPQFYSDASYVLTTSDKGGVSSRSAVLVYRLLREAGIPIENIDKTSWELAGDDSPAMGFVVPAAYNELEETRTYHEVISSLLQGSLLNVNLINASDGSIKIGLSKIQPISGATDFTVSDQDFREFSFEEEHSDVYSDVRVDFHQPDFDASPGAYNIDAHLAGDFATNHVESTENLYQTNKKYSLNTLHTDQGEGIDFARRISYILSQRRRLINLVLPQKFVGESFVGKTFTIQRDLLPGFSYAFGTANEIKAVVVEVEKNIENVRLTLDDQKGVQDNSGSW